MNEFLHRLKDNDRVLLVGDTRQHQAVEAGTPYQQLQEAGIQTARLDEIVRQKDPALKEVVEQLSRGNVREAIEKLDTQGRVHEIVDRDERLKEIAQGIREASRKARWSCHPTINRAWKSIRSSTGKCRREARWTTASTSMRVLVARQEITGADRQWAEQYEPGDVVRYTQGSKTHGIKPGEYARVERVNEKENLVTVKRENGEQVSYDPRRLHGVTLYRETERAFSEGDRVQFTAPYKEQHVANRELGTIEKIDASGNLQLRLDSGRSVAFNIERESASRSRLCSDEPQQPGTDRRPRARARGHRAGGRKTRQSAAGVCGGVAWPLRCADLHERQRPSDRATLARRVAPIRDGAGTRAATSSAEDRIIRAEPGASGGGTSTEHWTLALPLHRNRLHVLANDVVVPGLPIADVGPNDEYLAGEAEREDGLVLETDVHAECSIVDGMADVIHNLAAHFWILPTLHP